MTTGRINQVTILYPDAGAKRHDPRRGGKYQEGGYRSYPNHPPQKYPGHDCCERPIQLPPLSSPRCGPQRGRTGVAANNKPVTYAPQEEKTHTSSRTTKARILGRAVPKDLVNIWRSQQSTDPKWCPLIEISRTSVVSHKFRRRG
jgi:hypothetical protein